MTKSRRIRKTIYPRIIELCLPSGVTPRLDSVLQFQKEAIWRQMQEYKREYHLADERIRKLNIRNDRVEGTLKVVGKWWNTLIEDFRVMINRLSPLGIDELKSMLERESEKRFVFLRFLLSSSMTTDSESLDSYISSRCADAKNLLSQVISILESQSASSSSLSDNDTIKLIDTLQSRHHELNSKISDLESDLFRTTEKLKKTEHELNEAHSLRKRAEKRADRENSTTFKAAFHIEGGNNAKEQNEESNQNASASITSPQADNQQKEDSNGIPLTAQISYYTFLATNRLKEIETLKQERINLNKEIDDLKAKLIEIPETVILEHPVHKVALSQVTFLQKEVHQWRSMGESRGRELEELKRKKEKWLEGLNKEESVRFKNMEEQLKNTHAETVRLRQEREELRGKLALLAEKESYVRQDTNEIRTLANTLKCRINALENEIVRLKETIAIKMNDRSAVEFYAKFPNLALESDMRSRISELEEEVKALRSQLDAYKEAQNPAREMAEVLISEQNLKAQIEQLNKRISKFELILGSNINFDNPEVKSLVEKLSEKQKKIEELEVKVTGNDEVRKFLNSSPWVALPA
ncbi:hypothetical protein BKA69DRAFT_917603 [Paraphysoderma sedebokerense]|nr:hypothetical protein BKA69DRAFT_917603 [Paraphysoderma sedebokerense]